MRMQISDVLQYGPIVYNNDECGLLITANGAYLNAWFGTVESGFDRAECKSFDLSSRGTTYSIIDMPLREIMGKAEKWAKELLAEGE